MQTDSTLHLTLYPYEWDTQFQSSHMWRREVNKKHTLAVSSVDTITEEEDRNQENSDLLLTSK